MISNTHFAIVSVFGSSTALGASSLTIAPEISLASSLKSLLDPTWEKWLGEIQTNILTQANLNIIHHSSEPPHSVDSALDVAYRYYQALLIAKSYESQHPPFCIVGENHGSSSKISRISSMPQPVTYPSTPNMHALITQSDIETSRAINHALNQIFTTQEYLRLRRGIKSFIASRLGHTYEEKIHGFTRTMESLIFSDTGKSTGQFKSRTEPFVGPKLHSLMETIYNIRSNVEHMHHPFQGIPPISDIEFEALAVTFEFITRHALVRILTNPQILIQFSDRNINAFWSKDMNQIKSTLAPICDVQAFQSEIKTKQAGHFA